MDSTQNIISFCTGYGGLEIGIKRAGVDVRVICNVEIEAFVQANLVAKTEEGRMDNAPIWTDLKTFPAREFRGKVHGLIGGYPCQPFSSAGKRQGEKDPRHLWPYLLKHVRAIRPVWCFWENVAGHTTMGLWRVLSDLEEEGYRCAWGIFSAEEVGAPHQRKRVFILTRLGNSNVRYEGSHGIECGVLPTQTEDRQASGLERAGDTRQVGNPTSLRPHRGSENCEGEQSEVLGERLESDEVANTASREPRQSQARNGGQDISGGSEEELADSEGNDEQRRDLRQGEVQLGRGCPRDREPTRWPARPGEEQYAWEEPRVVADSKVKRCGGRKDKDGENGEGLSEQEGEERSILRSETEGCSGDGETTNDEAQSELGGAVDGTARGVDAITNRTDRLRLLGNGVIAQCAELAWKTLWKELQQ